ncbi:hypothetical protein AAA295_24005 [Klebsiella variicola]|uniref:hypothetical protein n=1 Tax=Klebsiella variicola TaxID=244366 RepID=UPI003130CBC9
MNELMEWPDVRLKNPVRVNNDIKSTGDFISWLAEKKSVLDNCLADLMHPFLSESPENRIDLILSWCSEKNIMDDADIILTLFCAESLHRHPEVTTWISVREVIVNSYAVEYWIKNALLALCNIYQEARHTYTSLFSEIFYAIERGDLKSNRHSELTDQLSHWELSANKLEEIWRGFRYSDPRMFAESSLFSFLADIDINQMASLLNKSRNPVLIDAVLMVSGAGMFSPRLSRWREFVLLAEQAFSQDGHWNGSIFLPMLLAHVCDRMKDIPFELVRRGKMIEDQYKSEIHALADSIAHTLYGRSDFAGIVTRWSAWLMRNIVLSDQDSKDFKHPDYALSILNDSLGRHTSQLNLPETSPSDAPDWETLCYFSARSSFANDNNSKLQNNNVFEQLWQRGADSFSLAQSHKLHRILSLHFRREGQSFPGISSHLLAYPLVQLGDTAARWLSLWNSAYFLREAAEFGLPEAPSERYSLRHNIGECLLVLCASGLAALDQMSVQLEEGKLSTPQSFLDMHQYLHFAVKEMMSIDDTINIKHWKQLFLHLCLRRVIWDGSLMDEAQHSFFPPTEKPDFQDYLEYYHFDIMDLAGMLSSAIRNNANTEAIKVLVTAANINLVEIIGQLKWLNQVDERRYSLNMDVISDLKPLLQ